MPAASVPISRLRASRVRIVLPGTGTSRRCRPQAQVLGARARLVDLRGLVWWERSSVGTAGRTPPTATSP